MTFIEKFMLLVFLGVFGIVVAVEVCLLFDYIRNFIKGKRSNFLRSKASIFFYVVGAIGVGCLIYGFFVEPTWVEVNHFTIKTDKLKNAKFRVVQFTDTHCDIKMRNEQKLIDTVKTFKPDVVVFTGDALNTKDAAKLFRGTMEALEANLAKLAIRGNWGWKGSDEELFGGTEFELLDGNKKVISKGGENIVFYGLKFGNASAHQNLLKYTSPDSYNVMLFHSPDLVEDVQGRNVDMYLCGHTHGGQIALPFYGALITFSKFGKKYEAGLYKVGETDLYTNRGLGVELLKARFFARPEIAVFDIVPE